MRSANRCKSNHQGDRCKKEKHHESKFRLDRADPIHQGEFTAWTDNGTVVAKFQQRAPKRNRRVNRLLQAFTSKQVNPALMPTAGRKTSTALLNEVMRYLRGGR